MPRISVVIVNYENWTLLQRCLDSLEAIKFIEIIVVDNCSPTNKLQEFSEKYPNIHFFKNSGNNGFANACNLGAKKSSCEYLFFLNPDAKGSENLLTSLLDNYLKIQNLAILGVIQVNEKNKVQAFEKPFPSLSTILGWTRALIVKLKFKNKTLLSRDVQEVPWVSGAAIFISKEWLGFIKGWDESFWMYFEDTALCKKATNLGGKVGILLNPTLLHTHGGSSRINPKTTAKTKLEVMISRHIYIDKYVQHYKKPTQLLAVVNHLVSSLIQSFIGIFLFFSPRGRMNLRLFGGLIIFYLQTILKKSWKSRRIS